MASSLSNPPGAGGVRPWLTFAALAVASVILARIFGQTYAIQDWLFFRYAQAWLWVFVFVVAVLSSGNLIVSSLSTPGERQSGHLVLSFATGVYAFFLAMFLVGIAGWLNRWTFFLVPGLLFALGAVRGYRDLRAWFYRIRSGGSAALEPFEIVLFALGTVGLAVIFVPTLIPENAAYDARWYHLPLAEHYVAEGAIRRFPEGAVAGTIPHLTSILYTWAFLAPGAELFDRCVLAAQLEFAAFLFTLAGIPVLVRCLVPEARARSAWVAIFLFPSIFIYDSTLTTAADHFAALWTIPAYVTMLRAFRELHPRTCLLFVIQICGLIMTKYTAAIAIAFPVLALIARFPQLVYARLRGRIGGYVWLFGLPTAFAAGLTLTAPHWLKNWLWYGDPAYPVLNGHLKPRPWTPDATFIYEVYRRESFQAEGDWSDKLQGTLRALYDYSFGLYNWESFHGWFPVVGSLFTFSLFALPVLKGTRRVWALVIAAHLGIAIWFVYFHQDRYLQSLLPWMAGGVAAIVILAWRTGLAARAGVVLLLGLQLVWGLEAIFWPTHQLNNRSGLALASDFFGSTMKRDFGTRTRPFRDMAELGAALPKGSKLLLHHDHLRFGVGVPTVTDAYRVQYGISYGYLTPPELHRLLRGFGVTHVAWGPEHVYGVDSLAAELVFHSYMTRLVNRRTVGSRALAELPPAAPPDEGRIVFNFSCDGTYGTGLYDLSDLRLSPIQMPDRPPPTVPPPRTPLTGDPAPLIARASYAVIESRCKDAPDLQGFQSIARWGAKTLYVRR